MVVKPSCAVFLGHVTSRSSQARLNLLALVALPVCSVVHQEMNTLRVVVADRVCEQLARLEEVCSARQVDENDGLGLPDLEQLGQIIYM
ncbi:MAG: hypothetical protein ACYSU7_15480 [Planctomycetota bacterium]